MSDVKICPTCGSEYPMSERFCPRDGSALKGQNPQGDLVGSMIASYHVIKKLGEGGMGAVYLAEHLKMQRKSAIKVMNPGMNQDPDAIQRFNREAANASRMNHPNICAIYDFGETSEGVIYLAMEFIEGESLTSLIERNVSLQPARAASILHQAADGLQVAHDYGIVHRDLKPDNIMIAKNRDGSDLVKVVDFGIAKAHGSESQKVTKTGLVVGTPEYMSPEQLSGDKLDGRSDIYSLALVGYNMLTGTLPFQSNSAQEAMIMRLTDQPRPLAEVSPNVAWPDELQAVMDKALARDANERYQKASDFGREFSMAVEHMPATAMAEAGTQVIGAASAAATAAIPRTRVASSGEKGAAKGAPAAPPPVKSGGKGMMIGGGVAVVAALGIGIAAATGAFSHKDKPPVTAGAPAPNQDSSKLNAKPPEADPNASKGAGNAKPVADQGRGKAPSGSAPVVTPPPNSNASNAPTAGAQIDKFVQQLDGKITDADAEVILSQVDALFPKAEPTDRTRIYFIRAQLFYQLDRDAAVVCRAIDNALSGAGLTSGQMTLMGTLKDQSKCK